MADQRADSDMGHEPTPGSAEDHRERRIWWMITAVGFAALLGVLWLGRPLVEGRLAAARNLDRAVAGVKNADGVLGAIDEEVRSSSASRGADPISEMHVAISRARSVLQEAETLSQSGYERLTEDEQERAMLVKAAAEARLAAIDAAEAVLSMGGEQPAAVAAKRQALEDYGRAIQKVKQADAALAKQ